MVKKGASACLVLWEIATQHQQSGVLMLGLHCNRLDSLSDVMGYAECDFVRAVFIHLDRHQTAGDIPSGSV